MAVNVLRGANVRVKGSSTIGYVEEVNYADRLARVAFATGEAWRSFAQLERVQIMGAAGTRMVVRNNLGVFEVIDTVTGASATYDELRLAQRAMSEARV